MIPMLFGLIFILTVNPPNITQHPKDQSILFQWKKNSQDLSDSSKYQGTKTHTLRILAVEESDEAHYSCLVKNDVGELLSDSALLRISKFLVNTIFRRIGSHCR